MESGSGENKRRLFQGLRGKAQAVTGVGCREKPMNLELPCLFRLQLPQLLCWPSSPALSSEAQRNPWTGETGIRGVGGRASHEMYTSHHCPLGSMVLDYRVM